MFNTSLDILYLVLSVSSVFLVIFICAALYQFIVAANKINRLASSAERIVSKGEELVSFLQERVSHSAAMFLGAAEVAKTIISMFKEKREDKKKKK